MLKKHMAACLIATAFAAAPALAQTQPSGSTDRPAASGSGSTQSGSPAMQPGTASPSTGSPSMGSSTSGSSAMNQSGAQQQGQFVTQLQAEHMMASDLIGTRVISANNESIGDINDVILDRNGQAIAAVIGVGGFLGIGEKDVAVSFGELEFATAEQVSAMNNNASGNNVSTTGSTATGTTGSTASGSATTGSQNMASNNAASNANNNQPQRVILRMTKAELEAAPKFDEDGNADNSGAGQSGTTAPRQ